MSLFGKLKLLSAGAVTAAISLGAMTGSAQAHGNEPNASVQFSFGIGTPGFGGFGYGIPFGYGSPFGYDRHHQRYHFREERQHDRAHDRLERAHDEAHYWFGHADTPQHRQVHRELYRQHNRVHRRLDRRHDDYHWYGY